ncbi:MAG: trypsin-like peptidase domain-containing protein [Planctomycetota bacterium]
MTQNDRYGIPPRSSGIVPLFVAGVALATAAWLVFDRFRPRELFMPADARTIEPRGELADFEKATIAIFEQNAPSVVHITSRALVGDEWQGVSVSEGTGTGFVWDDRGYIVTNWHVVQSVQSDLLVRFTGGNDVPAVLVGGIEDFDVAVLKLSTPVKGLRPIPIGSARDLRVGQAAFAIGNPFGLDNSLSTGVVSALDRVIRTQSGKLIRGAIQIDAAINPGNSGGPLLDSAGRLIGMNTAIVSPSGANAGIGFAIPVDTLNRVVPQLIRGDKVTTPGLGVELRQVTFGRDSREARPMVTGVVAGTGAEEAGLRARVYRGYGDVLLSIDGTEVHSREDVVSELERHRIGDRVKVRIMRPDAEGWAERTVEVELKSYVERR